MKKVCLIVPYFGSLPNYFPIFLESCKYNTEYNWIIFTDDSTSYKYPNNVKKIQMKFTEFKMIIQSKFDFNICLEAPYKLCDFKCAYGYILNEYLVDFDYWGYCDLDMIFGKISNFITEEMLEKYDKIGHLGHFTIYKNEKSVNELFMKSINGKFRYKEVYTTNQISIFDEWEFISINDIFMHEGKAVYFTTMWADIYPYDSYFRTVDFDVNDRKSRKNKENCFVEWNKGKLFVEWFKKGKLNKKEFMYAHFQKRNFKCVDKCIGKECLFILPNYFHDNDISMIRYILSCTVKKIINIKYAINMYKTIKYWCIVHTSSFRNKIRLMLKGEI